MTRRTAAILVLTLLLACISPRPAATAPMVLTDLSGHWAEAEITQAVNQRWVTGYPDGTFHPNAPVTRAEFVKMLTAALGLRTLPDRPRLFADTDGHWLQTSGWLWTGLMAGLFDQGQYPGGRFDPDGPIPREEAAMMATRALGRRMEAEIRSKPEGRYSGEVEVARLYEILRGDANSALRLEETTTRAQAVVIIQRVLQARIWAAVPVTAAGWQSAAPWNDCQGFMVPTLLVNIYPSHPFDGRLVAYARNCSATETYHLSAPDLRLVVNPYNGGHVPEPTPLFSASMPALQADLPPRHEQTMTVDLAQGLPTGWYTATLISERATATSPGGNQEALPVPFISTRSYTGATFLVSAAAPPAGEATVPPVYPAEVAGIAVPSLTAQWVDGTARFEVKTVSCQDGTGREMRLENGWTAAAGPGFATRLPYDYSEGQARKVQGIPGEAETLAFRAQLVVRTCHPDNNTGDLLGTAEVLWRVPLTN